MEKPLLLNGQEFIVEYADSDTRTAIANILTNRILIRLPRRWPSHERERAARTLERRMVKRILKNKARPHPVPGLEPEEKRRIVAELLPAIAERVETFNARHFQSSLGKIRIRNNSSNWGSCSPRNNLSLNFALLFLPTELLDYVIVHELAHTRVRNHSRKYWALVERVLPDYQARKKELKAYLLSN